MYTRLYKHTHTQTQTLTSTRFVLALEYIAYTSRIPWDDGWTRQCSNTAHFELNAATEKSFRKGLMPDGEIWPTHMCQPAYCWIESQENSSKTFRNFHVAVGGCRGDFFLSDVYEKFLKKFAEHDGSLSFSKMTKSCLAWRVYSCVHICLLRRWLYLSFIRGGCDTCAQRKETTTATLT